MELTHAKGLMYPALKLSSFRVREIVWLSECIIKVVLGEIQKVVSRSSFFRKVSHCTDSNHVRDMVKSFCAPRRTPTRTVKSVMGT